jgi:hypothetical protein
MPARPVKMPPGTTPCSQAWLTRPMSPDEPAAATRTIGHMCRVGGIQGSLVRSSGQPRSFAVVLALFIDSAADELVRGAGLAVDAAAVNLQKDGDAVASAAGDFAGEHARVQPQQAGGAAEVVRAAGQRRCLLGRGERQRPARAARPHRSRCRSAACRCQCGTGALQGWRRNGRSGRGASRPGPAGWGCCGSRWRPVLAPPSLAARAVGSFGSRAGSEAARSILPHPWAGKTQSASARQPVPVPLFRAPPGASARDRVRPESTRACHGL